ERTPFHRNRCALAGRDGDEKGERSARPPDRSRRVRAIRHTPSGGSEAPHGAIFRGSVRSERHIIYVAGVRARWSSVTDEATIEGLVVRSQSGFYTVRTPHGTIICSLPGRFKQGRRTAKNPVVIGD